MKNNTMKSLGIGFISSIGFFILLGSISAIITNPFFNRMTPIFFFDWIILILTSLLVGIYVGLYYYIKNHKNLSNSCAVGGGILGFLAFSCPVCNKLILFVLGFSGAMTYFAPIQPFLGIFGILLLIYANFTLIKKIKKWK